LTPEFRSLMENVAALEGCSLNEFAVETLRRAAHAVVQSGDVM